MFVFRTEQQVIDVGGVKLGGKPGQFPTVMIGSIFYHGDKIVIDPKKGVFDKEEALILLNIEEEWSIKTGNKRIIDICSDSTEAIIKYIDFVVDNTTSPFLIDGADAETRISATKYISEVGIQNRAIYNSINFGTEVEELSIIKESKINAAIILLFNERKPTIDGRLEILRGKDKNKGLLEIAKGAGIEKFLIDTSVVGLPDPGPSAKTVYLIKKEFGLPAGCGPHNAIARWKERCKLDSKTSLLGNIVAHTTPILYGADFVLYGPIKNATKIYMACALADAYVAYTMMQQYRIKPLRKEHPLFRIFKPIT